MRTCPAPPQLSQVMGWLPLAGLALGQLRHLDLCGRAKHRFGEIELELVTQVRTAEHL
jgi:hypothetical protein